MNKYFIKARLFPAILTSIPMLIFFNKVLAREYSSALKNLYDVVPIIIHLGLSAAIIFLCVHINRFLAKEIFQRLYFKEEIFMPSTSHLLWENNYYETETKNQIRDKITEKFKLILLNQEEEQKDNIRARKLIATSVSQIRIALKGNNMLLQHNIEYGFWRNLIGGCVLSIIFSIIIYFYGEHYKLNDLKVIAIISFVTFLLPIIFSATLIKNFGRYYSKILYEQFLSV
jgi:hypothetical protein